MKTLKFLTTLVLGGLFWGCTGQLLDAPPDDPPPLEPEPEPQPKPEPETPPPEDDPNKLAYCEIVALMKKYDCNVCHAPGAEAENYGPQLHLLTWEQLEASRTRGSTRLALEWGLMPPPDDGYAPISSEDLNTFNVWLEKGHNHPSPARPCP